MFITWELPRALHPHQFTKLSLHGDSHAEMLWPELSTEDICMCFMAGSESVCESCCEPVTLLVPLHPSQNCEKSSGLIPQENRIKQPAVNPKGPQNKKLNKQIHKILKTTAKHKTARTFQGSARTEDTQWLAPPKIFPHNLQVIPAAGPVLLFQVSLPHLSQDCAHPSVFVQILHLYRGTIIIFPVPCHTIPDVFLYLSGSCWAPGSFQEVTCSHHQSFQVQSSDCFASCASLGINQHLGFHLPVYSCSTWEYCKWHTSLCLLQGNQGMAEQKAKKPHQCHPLPRTDSLTGHVHPTKQTTPETTRKKKGIISKSHSQDSTDMANK